MVISLLTRDEGKNKKGDYVGNPTNNQTSLSKAKHISLLYSHFDLLLCLQVPDIFKNRLVLDFFLWSQFVPNRVNMPGQISFHLISLHLAFYHFRSLPRSVAYAQIENSSLLFFACIVDTLRFFEIYG